MRSLKKLNAAAGTSYTRWEQVVEMLKDVAPMAAEALGDKIHRGSLGTAEHTAIHARTPNGHEPHAHDGRNLLGTHEGES